MSGSGAPITSAELAKHTSRGDIWIALHGNVYDVTKWLVDHPGGETQLLENAGTDASEPFDAIGHRFGGTGGGRRGGAAAALGGIGRSEL